MYMLADITGPICLLPSVFGVKWHCKNYSPDRNFNKTKIPFLLQKKIWSGRRN
jgi:hypothetical protein